MAKAIAKQKVTREAFETALQGYVHNDNTACDLAAERDKELEPINNKYDPQFEKLLKEKDDQFEVVKQYCEENRTELFAAAKSKEEFGANIGFREGKYKVMLLEGFDEKGILAVMAKRKAWQQFVRMTPSIDKGALIKLKPKGMEKLGFKVDKEETFFLEPVKTETE